MSLYDKENIPNRLKDAMAFRNLSTRMVAGSIGVSHATVHRMMRGGVPDVESYLLVKRWLASEAHELVIRAKIISGGPD
jgi:predicted XRE-type DNA-binding protein